MGWAKPFFVFFFFFRTEYAEEVSRRRSAPHLCCYFRKDCLRKYTPIQVKVKIRLSLLSVSVSVFFFSTLTVSPIVKRRFIGQWLTQDSGGDSVLTFLCLNPLFLLFSQPSHSRWGQATISCEVPLYHVIVTLVTVATGLLTTHSDSHSLNTCCIFSMHFCRKNKYIIVALPRGIMGWIVPVVLFCMSLIK